MSYVRHNIRLIILSIFTRTVLALRSNAYNCTRVVFDLKRVLIDSTS